MNIPLFILLFLTFIGAVSTSSYWEFPNNNPNWDQQRTSRAQRLITLGKYSERDGDRDMLEGRQQAEIANNGQMVASVPSIWGFAPNYGTSPMIRAQREWATAGNGRTANAGGGQQQPLLDQQIRPSISQLDSPIARPLHSARVPIAANSPFSLGIHAIDRFETNLGRFATGPPPGAIPNRVILPPNFFEQVNTGISTESRPKNSALIEDLGRTAGFGQQRMAANGGQKEPPKTRILTNDLIPPSANGILPTPIVPLNKGNNWNGNGDKWARAFSSTEIPKLPDFRHEDIRPEIDGERLGPQGKFAGPSNQYKEDSGKELTTKGRGEISSRIEEYGPKWVTSGDGPASKLVGTGINAPPEGTHMIIGEEKSSLGIESVQNGEGKMRPYLNAAEELTGSRWRNIDEYFNNLNGGNKGRGPNRYVKVDLLNE